RSMPWIFPSLDTLISTTGGPRFKFTLLLPHLYYLPVPLAALSSSQALTCSFSYRHNRPALRQGSPCSCHFRTVGSLTFNQQAISRAVNSSTFIFPPPR